MVACHSHQLRATISFIFVGSALQYNFFQIQIQNNVKHFNQVGHLHLKYKMTEINNQKEQHIRRKDELVCKTKDDKHILQYIAALTHTTADYIFE